MERFVFIGAALIWLGSTRSKARTCQKTRSAVRRG
jgi:hypothetical protein